MRDKFFMEVLFNDIMDIKASFRSKQEELNHNDPVYNKQPGKDVKIKETKTFLALKKFQRDNRELMLSIFLDKPVPDNSALIKSVLSDLDKNSAERDRMLALEKQKKKEKKAALDAQGNKTINKVSMNLQKMTTEGEGFR